jgi:hypothetical protein
MSDDDGGLRPLFKEHLPHFDWQSIETGGTGKGVPDSNFCHLGAEGWIEFKQTEAYAVTLKPEQVGWHDRRARHGGYTFIAVRRWHDGGPRKGVAVDELWLLSGAAAAVAKSQGLRREARYILGIWEGGPSRWGWETISKIMTRRHRSGTEDTGG